MEAINSSGVKLGSVAEFEDEIEYGLGSLYPVPGGLKENVEFYLGRDAFVVQTEGELHVYEELSALPNWIKELSTKPVIIDALNCARGCAYGTATTNRSHTNHGMALEVHKLRMQSVKYHEKDESARFLSPKERHALLNKHFEKLKLQDFLCSYEESKASTTAVSLAMLESAYMELEKTSSDLRELDCRACGYKTCKDMATALALGINHKENCAEYTKAKLEEKQAYQQAVIDLVREVNKLMHDLEEDNIKISSDASNIKKDVENANDFCNEMDESLVQLQNDFSLVAATDIEIINIARSTNILSINASIEAAHSGAKGFAVIASEMRNLATKVMAAANKNHDNGQTITETLDRLADKITNVSQMVSTIKESAALIDGSVTGITDLAHSIVEKLDSMDMDS